MNWGRRTARASRVRSCPNPPGATELTRSQAMIDSANSAWTNLAVESIVVGVIATAVADLWVRLLQSVARIPGGNWALIGRWVAGSTRGVFVHRTISAPAPVRGELAIGWTFHYVVGIVYAAIYLLIITVGLHAKPSFISALLFAWVTLIAPWFVMQPALGQAVSSGFSSSRCVSRRRSRAHADRRCSGCSGDEDSRHDAYDGSRAQCRSSEIR